MDKQQEMHTRLRALAEEISYCGSFLALLHWDTGTFCPPGGQGARAKLSGYLAKMSARVNSSEEAVELLDYYESHKPENDVDAAIIREIKKQREDGEKLGMAWRVRFSELTSIGKSKWIEARQKNDFSIFEPVLRETFDLAREKGRLLGTAHPMEAFINDWDRGLSVKDIDRLFVDLRSGIVDILQKVKATGKDFDDKLLFAPLDKAGIAKVSQKAAIALGYNVNCGGFFETVHPFAAPIAATDARVSTNYSNFTSGFFSTIHEAGHSIYQQCVPQELCYTNLRSGWPGSLHESQSRFYENIIGKSREFTQWYFPMLQEALPEFRGMDAEQMYRMVNRVNPGCSRLAADELSYCLHPILRYELEKQLMDGSLDVHDLPEAWNVKSKEYLGVTPTTLQEGVLQDMQWSMGALGFFQSYSLGNLIDGQLRSSMLKSNPDIFKNMAKGELLPVTQWLGENVHKHQKVYLPLDILKNATGEDLSAKHYVEYLDEKYGDIYGF
ncbi:MAG: carboxypeptidase M32 [Oscillospiraceae bacterium]